MGRLNLYRKLDMSELDDCIEKSTMRVANFIDDSSIRREFIQLMRDGKSKNALVVIAGEMELGYGYLVSHLKAYLKAKEMMEDGEVVYTDLVNTDTVL